MTQADKELLLKDLCSRLPYGVKISIPDLWSQNREVEILDEIFKGDDGLYRVNSKGQCIEYIKPYLFPMSNLTDEDYTMYFKIWEDTSKKAYLDGCHHLITNIKAYKAANDYLLSKHYDINGLIPMGLAIDATDKDIY